MQFTRFLEDAVSNILISHLTFGLLCFICGACCVMAVDSWCRQKLDGPRGRAFYEDN